MLPSVGSSAKKLQWPGRGGSRPKIEAGSSMCVSYIGVGAQVIRLSCTIFSGTLGGIWIRSKVASWDSDRYSNMGCQHHRWGFPYCVTTLARAISHSICVTLSLERSCPLGQRHSGTGLSAQICLGFVGTWHHQAQNSSPKLESMPQQRADRASCWLPGLSPWRE